MTFSFHFCRKVSEVAAFHPDNARLWDGIVEREKAILFHFKTFQEVFEVCPPAGIDFYCYFVVLDEEKRLAAWMPGYFSERPATVVYGRGPVNKKGEWLKRVLFATPYFKKKFPEKISTRDLVLGHDMDQGKLFLREGVTVDEVMGLFLDGVESVRLQLNADSLSFLDVNFDFAQNALPFLKARGFIRRPGNGYAYVATNGFSSLSDYLEKIFSNPLSQYGRKDFKKMLEGNFVHRDMQDFVEKHPKGFGKFSSVDFVSGLRSRALELSRRNQARAWLMSNGFEKIIPDASAGGKRQVFFERTAEILLEAGYIADMNYVTWRVAPETIDSIFQLWDIQNQKYGLEKPYIDKVWFERMARFFPGACLFQVAIWGNVPMGFFFVVIHQGIFYSMFCGFDPVIGAAHNLYFNMHLQAFLEAKKFRCHSIALGPGDYRMNLSKRKLMARVDPSCSFIFSNGFRLPFHKRWTRLRWRLRRLGFKLGRFEVFPSGYLIEPIHQQQQPPLQSPADDLPHELVEKIKHLAVHG